MLNNPQGVVYPLGEQFTQHTNTRSHTAAGYQYCSCRGSYRGGVRQLLSPEQEMCGRYGKGKATWLTTLLIKTCQTALHMCTCVFSIHTSLLHPTPPHFHFCSCVRSVNVCACRHVWHKWERAKMLFTKLVSFILEVGGGGWGGCHSCKHRNAKEKKKIKIAVRSRVEHTG